MPKKEQPYKVISKPPKGYKLPNCFWDIMIRKTIERINNQMDQAEQAD
ncbi:hypothetical protein [Pelorhabdus rhamnosifermentans]|nr:hypothetical protein [Pelorhabdus rhamnosifermentans]